jgi:hypothetical protein
VCQFTSKELDLSGMRTAHARITILDSRPITRTWNFVAAFARNIGWRWFLDLDDARARGGQIVDATTVSVPKQRNTKDENEARRNKAGRKPYDAILKFKIVVLQSLHNLSDQQTESPRASFRHRLDVGAAPADRP